MLIAIALACLPIVTDGDTFRCAGERIRLIAIDAPELRGHCRRGRQCAPGDARRSKWSLARALQRRPLVIRRFGRDHYGRTIAAVEGGGHDLSCHQLRAGMAIYVRRWDNEGWVGRLCGYSQAMPSPSRSR